MVFTIIALKCLGYSDDAPEVVWAHQQLHGLILEDADSLRFQPCKSPIWDTAISAIALHDAGLPSSCRAIQRAGDWLLSKEVRTRGDWSVRRPGLEASGWYFEFRNEHYPDIDDTTMVLLALDRVASPKGRAAIERAVRWVLGMQNRDGGWAAFDVDVNREILTHVPFADHNAMLDPSCADITGRVLEVLGTAGYRPGQPAVDRAVAYLMASQEPEGCWYGRWGVNYIYGTWQVFVGLDRAGFDMTDPRIRRGVEWLRGVQQPCGGWGESCASYDDPSSKGRGIPTASQTAWAVLALLAAGEREHPAVERGIRFLLRTQQADGSWSEDQFTGTGFPRVFYLKYHLYRVYFPLMALARYAACTATPAGVGSGLTSILRTERRAAESPAHFECAGGPLWAGTFERDRASAQRSSVFFS